MNNEVRRCKNFFVEGKVVDHYVVEKLIGCGGYGCVFSVFDQSNQNKRYAMKVEYIFAPAKSLLNEIQIMKSISGKSDFFPTFIESGMIDNFRYLVMNLYGPSVSTVRKQTKNHKFPFPVVLKIGLEMLKAIEALDSLGIVHCDIKPSNFLFDPKSSSFLKLIDFGLSENYYDSTTKKIRPTRYNNGFKGTMRYASIHSHEGIILSPRDDLMSWFYSLVEMAEGTLPWYGNENNSEVLSLKKKIRGWKFFKNSSFQMFRIYSYIKNLGYSKKPDYQFIYKILGSLIKKYQNVPQLNDALPDKYNSVSVLV